MSTTCERCLAGVHRCLTPTCACSTCARTPAVRRPPAKRVSRNIPPTRSTVMSATLRPTPFQVINSAAFARECERLADIIHG